MALRYFSLYISLFLGTIFILAGEGLVNTYFPIYAKKTAGSGVIGLFTSFYYVGFLLGCTLITRVTTKVGHIRTFSFVSALVGASALSFTIIPHAFFWGPLRFILGFGYAGLYVVLESWINSQSSNLERGKVFSLYRIVELSSLSAGQFLLVFLVGQTPHKHFSIVTLLTILSALPLSLTKLKQPVVSPHQLNFSLHRVWKTSSFSTISMFLVGMLNSSIWMLSPLFIVDSGYEDHQVPKIFVLLIIGGILSQYPIGHWSDGRDRRKVIALLTFLCLFPLVFIGTSSLEIKFYLTYFFLGVLNLPIYSLVMTHAMDRSPPEEMGQTSAQLLFLYSFGAIIGPSICGILLEQMGPNGFIAYLILIFAIFFFYSLYDAKTSAPVPSAEKKRFHLFPEGSPIILLLRKIKS